MNRLKHLKDMHQTLNKQIDGLEKTGRISDDTLTQLKKQRLKLKDQIIKIEQQQRLVT